MAKKAGLQLIISLVDEATSGLQKITGGMKGLALVGGAAVVAGMAAVGKAAWDAGQIYDEAMDTIITKTGASGDVLAALENDFKTVFSSVPTDAKTAADVIAELNQKVGMTGPALQGASAQLLEMTRMLGGDAAANASNFGRVMGDWSLTADQAGGTLDKMFVAAQQSGIGIDTLMQKVVQFGAPLRNMGFTLDESVALLASLEKEGVNTELVLGSLRIAAGKFAKEGKPLKESLMATFDAIQKNTDASAALAMGMEVFGARAGPDMVAAIREGRFSVDDLAAAMAGAEGAIMKTADATADFPEKFQVLKNKVTTLLMPLGNIMVTGLSAAVDAIGPAIDGAIAWIQKVTGEGTVLGTMWTNIKTIAQTVWPGIRDAISESMRVVGSFIRDNVIPAIGLLVAWMAEKLPPAIAAASEFWNTTLLPAIKTVAAFIREKVIPVVGEIITWLQVNLPPAIQTASDFFNNVILPAIRTVAAFIREKVIPVVGEIITWLQVNLPPAIQTASDFFNNVILPAIRTVANFIVEKVIPTFQAINTWLGEKIGPVIEIARYAFKNVLLPVLTLIWDIIVQKLIPIIKQLNEWLGATIIKAIGRAKDAFSQLKQKLDPVLNVIKDIVSWIKTQLQPTIDKFKDFIGGIHFGNPFSGLLDTIKGVIDKISEAIRKLRELLGLTGGVGGQSSGSNVSAPRFALAGAGGQRTGAAFGTATPGNTFVFNFAAPATAYDERKIETSVERAMLRAGVRADAIRRTR